jgi:hypothetical protein
VGEGGEGIVELAVFLVVEIFEAVVEHEDFVFEESFGVSDVDGDAVLEF